jgi:hypothetical protein
VHAHGLLANTDTYLPGVPTGVPRCLANKKTPTTLEIPQDPRHRLTVCHIVPYPLFRILGPLGEGGPSGPLGPFEGRQKLTTPRRDKKSTSCLIFFDVFTRKVDFRPKRSKKIAEIDPFAPQNYSKTIQKVFDIRTSHGG